MLLRIRSVDLVPYAADAWSFADLRVAGFSSRGLRLETGVPIVDAGVPTVRLHGIRYELAGLTDEDGDSPPKDPARVHFKALCSPWDRTTLAFIDAYFARIRAMLDKADETFLRKVAAFRGLYGAADWWSSAPAPLPRAHLFAPPPGPERMPETTDFLKVDIAFRAGGKTFALLSEASFATPKSARTARERLEANGIAPLRISILDPTSIDAAIDAVLSGDEARFWEADPLPRGIVPPTGLDL